MTLSGLPMVTYEACLSSRNATDEKYLKLLHHHAYKYEKPYLNTGHYTRLKGGFNAVCRLSVASTEG